ncbi:hypothetical protein [Thermococcus sp. 2319x1]|uniref:hypothetical protein n=1 Tax=Thermococcus sp. 2319x1 TaxID=1674923 RepID=UPI0015837D10|nr:hypothetical protein [Thermococcus sp. 2319x1]
MLISIPATTHQAYSNPYWFKEGTYIKYVTNVSNPPTKGEHVLSPAFMKKHHLLREDIVVTNVSFT